jgi:AcrR family transcriptional regulator
MGLRERKKEQTRQLIAETAWRLFADRGFEQVTVAEVARQAQVAVATVFNYFPTKEDLFFFRLETFGADLVDAIGTRAVEEPALRAFRRHLLESGGLLSQVEAGDLRALERLRTVNRVIAASPALQAREQQAFARTADALAALLAADTGAPPGDLDAQVVANALIGVQRALVDYTRRRVLADEEPARFAADVRAIAQRAFAPLEHGLGGYAPNQRPHAREPAGDRRQELNGVRAWS